jgi:hypothetical protein
LQHLLRIFKYVAVFLPRAAQHFGGQLRGNLDTRHGTIFRHVANFVDSDAGFPGQRGFELFGQHTGLVVSTGKSTHKSRKVTLCGAGGKMNTGDTGTHQQLRETFLRSRGAQRHAV